jgi:dTDP-4-dehydrorhamnose reductase
MNWLITGAGGMLGRDLTAVLGEAGEPGACSPPPNPGSGCARPEDRVTALNRHRLDILDEAAVTAAVAGHDVVLNAAAWTDVDGAEAAEAAATAVNGTAVAVLARACAATGARLVHPSTDYVFAGDGDKPYPEDAPTDPINAYGRGKLAGERAVLALLPDAGYVVRTAWLYGERGKNFVTTMLTLAAQRDTLDVVDDQHGQPTWSYALARRLVALGRSAAPAGIYHGTATGQTTWYGLARAVFIAAGLDPDRIRPTTSDRYPRPARRPAYSVLGHDRWADAGLPPLPDWRDQLAEALTRPGFRGLFPPHAAPEVAP